MEIPILILGHGSPHSRIITVEGSFIFKSAAGVYKAADVYQIEVDWSGNETLLYVPGKVIEFTTAPMGMEMLEVMESGEQQFKAPNLSDERENNDDDE